MKLHRYFLLAFIVILSFAMILINHFKKTEQQPMKLIHYLTHQLNSSDGLKVRIEQVRKNITTQISNEEQLRLSQNLSRLAVQISQLGDQTQFENQLKELAQAVSPQDQIFYLKKALDHHLPGDERLAAISLIKESKNSDTVLSAIITNPLPFLKDTRRQEQEFAFRALAIEGIRSTDVLSELQNQVQSPFLLDRLLRQKAFLKQQAPSPDEQDQSALKKLIGQ